MRRRTFRTESEVPEITGIDHIYIAVSDLTVSEAFYDKAMPALGFRKSVFELGRDRHIQYSTAISASLSAPPKAARTTPMALACTICASGSTAPTMSPTRRRG